MLNLMNEQWHIGGKVLNIKVIYAIQQLSESILMFSTLKFQTILNEYTYLFTCTKFVISSGLTIDLRGTS